MPVQFEIHPAIGIARVGNSDQHFVFDGPNSSNSPRRDASGRLLRQAVEFRIYRCDRDPNGRVTSAEEISTANATIQWSVHVANRKAAAPRFASDGRRNNSTGSDQADQALIIDSGVQTVSRTSPNKDLSGRFQSKAVQLGKISMQENGRLLFIGSDGSASSPTNQPVGENGNFADNDGWFDTMSDGVLRAKVTPNGGQESEALAAWVVVAPPDYAPGITNLVTIYDVLLDKGIERGVLPAIQTVVFSRHVRPILERAMGYQWVNRAARMGYDGTSGGHSSGGLGDFSLQMDQLGDPTAPNGTRVRIFSFLRDPEGAPSQVEFRRRMPRLNDDNNTGDVFTLTRTQYGAMRRWSQGQFVNDASAEGESEPERLTRTALEACAGGPFFPGIEAGRIIRDASIYKPGEAFRFSPDRVKPGGITQNNAVPWQADFHLCRWEEAENGGVKRLGWWPAQRPDDVLKTKDADPVSWSRGLADVAIAWVKHWHRLGFVREDPSNPGVFIERDRDQGLAEDILVA